MGARQAVRQVQRVRLKGVQIVDFRKSDVTLYLEWARDNPGVRMGADDAICFVSGSGDQIMFVRKLVTVDNVNERGKSQYTIVPSLRLRLDGTWHPYMLAYYAEQVGLDIGMRAFESALRDARAARRAERAGA